ncbi:MAG: serine hydrolase [Melioribacteraceae bacterium]|nr:serine hydrolase [Melioribacteraceae bacterium]
MMKRIFTFCFSVILIVSCQLKNTDDNLVLNLMESDKANFSYVLDNLDKHEVQVLYTEVNRDSDNTPHFVSHTLKANNINYFYPASSVKLYAAILALQKLNELNINELDGNTSLKIDSSHTGQSTVLTDSTSENTYPSIAHYIKKLFLVSDNDAFNRLYEFCGQQYLNEELWERGFDQTQLFHRLSIALSREENRNTNQFTFYDGAKTIYEQKAKFNEDDIYPMNKVSKGLGYKKDGELITEPMDFTYKNHTSIENLQLALRNIIFPGAADEKSKFNLTDADYKFLQRTMAMFPRESNYPKYNLEDNYVKFSLFEKDSTKPGGNVRIMSKIGMAYGFLTENAYVFDVEAGVEYFLSAVIYVNENQIFNDNIYEYEKTGFPFLEELSRVIYNHELKREKKYKADLSEFDFNFSN